MSSLGSSKLKLGFRFHPTDEELINYLKNFVLRKILPPRDFIKVADLFEDSGPWQIVNADSGEKIHYFLSRLNRFKNSSKKFARTAGKGTWKGQNSGDPIEDGLKKNIPIGYKRSLKYNSNIERDQNDKWLMKEYVLADHEYIKNSSNKDTFVICKIKNKKKREKKNTDDEVTTEEDVDEYIDYVLGSNYDNHQVIANDDDHQLGFANEVNNEARTNDETSTSTLNDKDEDYVEGWSAEYIDHLLGCNQDNHQVITIDDDNQLAANEVNCGVRTNTDEANTSTFNNGHEVYGAIEESNGINPYENYRFDSLVKMIDFQV